MVIWFGILMIFVGSVAGCIIVYYLSSEVIAQQNPRGHSPNDINTLRPLSRLLVLPMVAGIVGGLVITINGLQDWDNQREAFLAGLVVLMLLACVLSLRQRWNKRHFQESA